MQAWTFKKSVLEEPTEGQNPVEKDGGRMKPQPEGVCSLWTGRQVITSVASRASSSGQKPQRCEKRKPIDVEEYMQDLRKIRLHAFEGTSQPAMHLSGQEERAQQKLILVIDDSPTMRKLLAACFHRAGFRVVTFADGIEAMRWLSLPDSPLPDLVLLDIELPRLNGYEVARQLKAVPRFEQTAIVMLSRHDGILDRLRGRLAGAKDYLCKPVKTQEMLAAVAKHLGVSLRNHHLEEEP